MEGEKNAAGLLGAIGDPRAIEPLIAALKDKHSLVSRVAAEALVKIDTPAVDLLIATLNYNDDFICIRAAEALGEIGDPRAVDPLIAVLNDGRWRVRRVAAKA